MEEAVIHVRSTHDFEVGTQISFETRPRWWVALYRRIFNIKPVVFTVTDKSDTSITVSPFKEVD